MVFRTFTPQDQSELLAIFHSNCPKYFDSDDEKYLIDYLESYADENFLVVLNGDEIIGCGGHYTKADRHGIAWTMFKRHAIGAKHLLKAADALFAEIERRIVAEGKNLPIFINTTQVMERLFNRYGFVTYETISDGFGKGLDEYKMRKEV